MTPANGPKRSCGISAIARIDANLVADPVVLKTNRDNAKLCILEPIKDVIFPNIKSEKFFSFKRLNFIFTPFLHN